CQQYNNDPLTF
nr:immunoglobulin light chain junction region [Macaca mulatta]